MACCLPDVPRWYALVPILSHESTCLVFALVVGQAGSPSPQDVGVRLAVVNRTAVYGKIDRLLKFEADLVTVSETSATSVVQKDCSRELSKAGFKSFWSKPVASKKSTLDCRPSYRGEAVGSAIFTGLPCHTVQEALLETQRFSSCIVRIADFEVIVISLYGFANRHKEGIRPNDILIAGIIPVIAQVGLPFLVAGDFNEPLLKLPAYKYFQDIGAVEAFQWYTQKFQKYLPPTCCGSTRKTQSSCTRRLLISLTTCPFRKSMLLMSTRRCCRFQACAGL